MPAADPIRWTVWSTPPALPARSTGTCDSESVWFGAITSPPPSPAISRGSAVHRATSGPGSCPDREPDAGEADEDDGEPERYEPAPAPQHLPRAEQRRQRGADRERRGGQPRLQGRVVQAELEVLREDEERAREAGEVEDPDARPEHVAADREQLEADHRLARAAVAALVHEPQVASSTAASAEQRRPERAVPAALLDERHEEADHGEPEQHDAERVELGPRARARAARPAGSGVRARS